ncbi:MAG TPA: extracellular solute-binding protein [Anaerolineales bacterium]|nr:extracellular solute-binding protein [Anaerolineales bacterium]
MTFRRASLSLLLAFLAACQSAPIHLTQTPSAPAAVEARPTATPLAGSQLGIAEASLKGITIQVWHPWFGVEANLFQSQVDEFNQTNQWGLRVLSTSQLDYNELFQDVETAFASSSPPQLVIALSADALVWNANGDVVDLTNYVNDPQYGFGGGDVKDIPSVFWSQDEAAGQRLGIPAERSARFVLYNESWARELGFNSAPVSADEFRQQACAAHATMLNDKDKSNDAMGGWLVDTQPMTALSWLTAFGGGVLDGNNYRFLTPNNIAALTFLKQLYADGCAWTTSDSPSVYDAFATRKALFSTASLEELSDQSRAFGAANSSDEWTVLAFPGNSQSGLFVYGSSYIMLKSTPQQQLASWLFMRWMLSPENQAKWVEALGLFPLRATSMELLKDYSDSHPQWNAALALLPNAQIQPQLASWRKVQTVLGDGFSYMFRTGLDNQPAIASNQPAAILSQMDSIARELSK